MEFAEYVDLGNAADIFVDGVGAINLYGDILQVSYTSAHQTPHGLENRLAVTLRWSRCGWMLAATSFYAAHKKLLNGQPLERLPAAVLRH